MENHHLKIINGLIGKKLYFEALNYLNNLKKNHKQSFQIFFTEGLINFHLKKITNAIKSLKKAIEINPQVSNTYLQISECYRINGELDNCRDALEKCIDLNEKNEVAYYFYSNLIDADKNSQILSLLKKNLTINPSSPHLNFALAKIYEKKGQYQKSFEHYKNGNNALGQFYRYNDADEKKNYEILKKIFSNKRQSDHYQKNKDLNLKVIFICGMPRSGTTLVEQIISSHSNVKNGGELSIIPKAFAKFINYSFTYENINLILNQLNLSDYNFVRNQIIEQYENISKNQIITDKLPSNFRNIGFIKFFFPEAKIIFCNRDPRDNLISIFKNFFDINMKTLNYVNSISNIQKEILFHNDLMKHWGDNYNFYKVNYEKLVNDPDTNIKMILKYCELDFEQNCLDFYKNKNNVFTLSSHQVRQPIYNASVSSWKNFENFLDQSVIDLKRVDLIN